jgi:hypothetical protein
MFTCGLQNVGVPSEGQPQHGDYRTLPALAPAEARTTTLRIGVA